MGIKIFEKMVVTRVESELNLTRSWWSQDMKSRRAEGHIYLCDIMLLPTSPKNLLKFGYELIPNPTPSYYKDSLVKRIKQ